MGSGSEAVWECTGAARKDSEAIAADPKLSLGVLSSAGKV